MLCLRHFACLAALALGACNPSNTQDACTDIAHAYCQRIFDVANQGCDNASAFLTDNGFASLDDCASSFVFLGHTCADLSKTACAPEDYSANRASACASYMTNLQCSYDWSAGPGPATSDCTHVCCLHSGNLGSDLDCCSGTSHYEYVGGCMSSTYESVCD